MALLKIPGAAVRGIAACVPETHVDNTTFTDYFSEKEIKKIIRATGIRERRFAREHECGSDFAGRAAEALLKAMKIEPYEIGILIYLTQTPDYMLIPPTSCILQHRLGLAETTAAFDINMNCSGFVYALSTAMSYAAHGMKTLLLVGETLSKVFPPSDKATGLLFGDGGAAILVESKADEISCFSLNTDGAEYDAILVEAGGYRLPASPETVQMRSYEDGSRRSLHHGRMDGMRVFDFTQQRVLPDLKKVLEFSRTSLSDVDYFFFHQANKFMLDLFAMELGVDKDKVPISLDRFGNTSTVSIPLGIAARFGDNQHHSLGTVAMSAFGGGLSWGSAVLSVEDCYIHEILEI